MATFRQVQLRLNGEQTTSLLSLSAMPYKLEGGSWRCDDGQVQMGLVIQASTLAELDRYVTRVRHYLALADAFNQGLHDERVYLYQKTCDALSLTAEIGATWMRTRVWGGRVIVPDPSTSADTLYTVAVRLELDVDAVWERAGVAQVLLGDGGTSTSSDGGVTQAENTALSARRINWSPTSGLTVRVHWVYRSTGVQQVHFFRDTTLNMRLFWSGSGNVFMITDAGGNGVSTLSRSFTEGQVVELVGVWSTTRMAIYVDGVLAAESVLKMTLSSPTTFVVLKPDTGAGSQSIVNWQLWPQALTPAECVALAAWGRPSAELCYAIAPASSELTACHRWIYNVPGDTLAPMRLVVGGSADFDQVLVHMRQLAGPSSPVWECEAGTLGANTAVNSNGAASGGSQARFTPASTGFATRVTLTLAADPDDVASLRGRYRLYLAAYDSAAATNTNLIRWRLVIAGVADAWSPEYALAAVTTRSLVDLGTMDIPSGQWPDEALYATTDVAGGSYVTLELQVSNTIGSGTLDLDAIYLAPAEQEVKMLCADFSSASQWVVIDYVGAYHNAIMTRSLQSLEFAAWGELLNGPLTLAPRCGLAAFLWLYGLRSSSQEAWPRDTATIYLYYRSRYVP